MIEKFGSKITPEIVNKEIEGTLIPAYIFPVVIDVGFNETNSFLAYEIVFKLITKPDNKVMLQIKCETKSSLNKKLDDIKENDVYEDFKKTNEHISDWLIESNITEVRPVFPSFNKLSPLISKLISIIRRSQEK